MRRAFFLSCLLMCLCILPTSARAASFAQEAQTFIEQRGREAIDSLGKPTMIERYDSLKDLVPRTFDLPSIARFSLGPFWRDLDKNEQEEFLTLFGDYVLSLYAKQDWGTADVTLTVTKSIPVAHKKDQALVYTRIEGLNQSDDTDPLEAEFRIRKTVQGPLIFDVKLYGSSLNMVLREELAQLLRLNEEDISAFFIAIEDIIFAFEEELEFARE